MYSDARGWELRRSCYLHMSEVWGFVELGLGRLCGAGW